VQDEQREQDVGDRRADRDAQDSERPHEQEADDEVHDPHHEQSYRGRARAAEAQQNRQSHAANRQVDEERQHQDLQNLTRRLGEFTADPPPEGFDAVEHVSRSLARVPWGHEVEVLLDLPLEQAARRLPATLAELVEADDGTLLRMRVDSLDWMAGTLASLRCGFTILAPDELRTSVRELASRLAAAA
jgi:hypothetical protein